MQTNLIFHRIFLSHWTLNHKKELHKGNQESHMGKVSCKEWKLLFFLEHNLRMCMTKAWLDKVVFWQVIVTLYLWLQTMAVIHIKNECHMLLHWWNVNVCIGNKDLTSDSVFYITQMLSANFLLIREVPIPANISETVTVSFALLCSNTDLQWNK